MLRGSAGNISYVVWLLRGGTGLLGITDPRLVFEVEAGDGLVSVPQSLDIDYQPEDSCQASGIRKVIKEEILLKLSLPLKAKSAGKVVISTKSDPNVIDTTSATVTINIINSEFIKQLVSTTGWLYFLLWSVSFYPQIILNLTTSSVQGLNMDFVILNMIGFALYSIFNIEMYFDPKVKFEYQRLHPDGVLPVQLNDVVFAVHAFLAASVTLAQCILLRSTHQRLSLPTLIYLSLITILVIIIISLCLAKLSSWLTCLYLLSYLKLLITVIKFIPQVVMNYRHKSTRGWSVGNVVLDLAGGLASLLQMILVALNSSDWTSLTGDLTKLGLSLVSLGFDILFLFQHFVLYKDREPYQQIH